MPQSITLCTALSASARRALWQAGYETTDDLANVHTEDLARELGLSVSECDGILEATQRTKRDIVPSSQPASQLMGAESHFPCPKYAFMDRLLPGGLSPGHIVEISGPPGTIKDAVGLEYVRSALTFGKEVIIIDLQNMITAGILRDLFQSWCSGEGACSYNMTHVRASFFWILRNQLATMPSYGICT